MLPDIDAVTALIHEVGAEIIMPRFRSLKATDVHSKASSGDLDDIVTVADQEAEATLIERLRAIAKVPVVGEEGVAADPSLLALLRDDDARWVVDPLDGTKNFAAGHDGFGVMVSFVEQRQVRAAWIHLPARSETFVACRGQGAVLNGARIRVPGTSAPVKPRASVFVRFMPPTDRDAFTARVMPNVEPVDACGAAAVEYTDVLRGRKDLVVYYRLLPWDHGAPALILEEAGGCAVHLNGAPYSIASQNQVTLLAHDRQTIDQVRRWTGATA